MSNNKYNEFKQALSKAADFTSRAIPKKYRDDLDRIIKLEKIDAKDSSLEGFLLKDREHLITNEDIDLYNKILIKEKERNENESMLYGMLPFGVLGTLGTFAIFSSIIPIIPIALGSGSIIGALLLSKKQKRLKKEIKTDLESLNNTFKPAVNIIKENLEYQIGISPSLASVFEVIIPPAPSDFTRDPIAAVKKLKSFKKFKGYDRHSTWSLENKNFINESGIKEKRVYLIKKQ